MADWVIEAEKVRKTFAWTPVLHDISCQIGAGEIVSIFGPNGAGKTTLLRILATLLHPSQGKLRLFGHSPTSAVVRRRLGFLGHDSFLYPDLTPVENLTFYGRAYQLTDISARIETAPGTSRSPAMASHARAHLLAWHGTTVISCSRASARPGPLTP